MAIKDSVFNSLVTNEPAKVTNKSRFERLMGITPLSSQNTTETASINNKNVTQTKHKSDTNGTQKITQTSHKINTNTTQFIESINESPILKLKTPHNGDTKPNTIVDTNVAQTKHKPLTKNTLSTLSGLQRELLVFIYNDCKSNGSKVSNQLTRTHISDSLSIKKGSVKTSLERLVDKGHLIKNEIKDGRGGWVSYEIAELSYRELLQLETSHKLTTKHTQLSYKANTEVNTEVNTVPPSSSSFNNIETTTTKQAQDNNNQLQLSYGWQEIDITPLEYIGFSKHHLKQIANQNKISTALVQESINAFAFDLKQNGKGKTLKTSPINYLMGILRNGIPYSPPSNYESEESRAMRIYLERKREIEQKQIELEEELLRTEFNDWQNTLTNEQIDKILPEDIKNSTLAPAKIACLRTYYRNEIWPIKRQEIINKI